MKTYTADCALLVSVHNGWWLLGTVGDSDSCFTAGSSSYQCVTRRQEKAKTPDCGSTRAAEPRHNNDAWYAYA
jgi:hypothetical protein